MKCIQGAVILAHFDLIISKIGKCLLIVKKDLILRFMLLTLQYLPLRYTFRCNG